MSDGFWTALFSGLAPTLMATASLVQSIKNNKQCQKTADKVDEVHKLTNGMSEKLADQARAEGVVQGAQEEKDRDKTNGPPEPKAP